MLQDVSQRVSHRFELRRRMMGRMGIAPDPDLAVALSREIRATVLACAECGNTDICAGWLDQGGRGLPVFCRARQAFADLARAAASAEGEAEEACDVVWVSQRLRALPDRGARGAA
ncbi:DUF6455 family protein [Histidinibacterium lentulum]|uniref:DUF6455 domain-containing protein n=1 Tax=Histidinibacterium lentulum TaxID=2480588 RepID=A0A3N2R844_9RHOB|nr:DUF6455 family protein [Histidinibacterium lentulum]ROU03588.1 hypothetical protein EAT49_04640 [Histidinibacterium lentulum]